MGKPKIDPRTLQNLAAAHQHQTAQTEGAPILAIDFGEKFCGLAWTPDRLVVLPLKVVPHQNIETEIRRILTEKNINDIVFGLPIDGDGNENHVCAKTRQLAQKFSGKFSVTFINERFSSQATITPSAGDRIDDLAAAQILEFWLRSN